MPLALIQVSVILIIVFAMIIFKEPGQQSRGSQALQAVSSEQQRLARLESRVAGQSRSAPSPGSPEHDGHHNDQHHIHDDDDHAGDDGEL